ncbi:MAG: hypothetical protein A3C80_03875 [Candidatus Ryanbacteria bacterium RIFCSPHIGHO2_02_FULL_45_43]|uniref:SH3b domain-containing protein n=1 Tax=Candidatus Ryanbacteria bacterium RIFCSPHIGHO2_01_45_13 TaxID=1802112 RepID=A0A1G2G0B2_9BACT|nr:MAG: hypothetical protein A2718_01295 [Candidatus Ryanbacteria bacterium RIFCSPHIGHO2_01_FULL_44_130]OGZ43537.1 MAG: hypothetical protein A2W41_04365 [Candidatus Ryanbacteria bacterium RIFCSPHIGHO2_01_45_13]OGZ47913.1 MAG: hypothetical protein A3C80_03875 [Candidatus Ryanbacteria bacterium RIFCSPHIGHO2_02_FULL_45_43]OGZ49926.1 MAG: hypothetical protein A3E55_03910 [Candidatus Ryanbacteria bacterium RIFCSPHIGHO2_12_FULL_44_20]OGZ51036.1 MAG: hypothetical protein A3A17_03450 [Candidatus Ryanba
MAYLIFSLLAFFVLAHPAHALVAELKIVDAEGNEKKNFSKDEDVYLAGKCALANGNEVKIFISRDKSEWTSDQNLSDVSGEIETVKIKDTDLPIIPIWKHPLNNGSYDVIIDSNGNFKLDSFENCIAHVATAGFTVESQVVSPSTNPQPQSTPSPVYVPPLPPPPPAQITVQQSEPPKPSTIFSLEERIEVKSLSNVRASAGGSLVGQQPAGVEGVIVGGPVYATLLGIGYWFWNIDYDIDPDGWTAEKTLKIAEVPPPEPESEPTPPLPTESTEVLEPPAQQDVAPSIQDSGKESELAAVSENSPVNNIDVLGGIWGAGIIGLAIVLSAWILGRAVRKRGD